MMMTLLLKSVRKNYKKAENDAWKFGYNTGLLTTGLTLFVGFLGWMYVDKKKKKHRKEFE